jgi:glucosylceramidase
MRILFFGFLMCGLVHVRAQMKATCWLTDPARQIFFTKQQPEPAIPRDPSRDTIATRVDLLIRVDARQSYQSIDGYGWALTGGSAQHIIHMSAPARAALLKDLFSVKGDHIGGSYLRISIGASDLNDHVFSYDDLPAGQTDTSLSHFDLGPDIKDVIPVLKEILTIFPSLKIVGSPWSAPAWMKTNNDTRGGSLKPEYNAIYARYFVKYIQAMAKEGIRLDAITVQNEPLHPGNNPSMYMPAPEQAAFVKNFLGPAFKQAGIRTRIIIYDHNCDKPEYPISILDDPEARQYIDGSAFHLYGGTIEAMSKVHEAYPSKNLYFTEQWVGAPGDLSKDIPEHIENLVIGATRNWSRNVIEWNLAADPDNNPHTDRGGCDRCLGAVTIDGDKVTRNPAYYIVAHAAKFVRPGSVRIASELQTNGPAGSAVVPGGGVLPNVAFRTPAGKTVLIVLNKSDSAQSFIIRDNKGTATQTLGAGAVATYVW